MPMQLPTMLGTTSSMGVPSGAGQKKWVVEIQQKSEEVDTNLEAKLWMNRSIYQVPSCIKDLNPKAYSPQVISFGPYHHGEVHLLPMEEHKQRALFHFLKRANLPLSAFLEPLSDALPELMAAYEKLDASWREDGGDPFLRLMLVDGCFMLELLRYATGGNADYAHNDPIFSNHGMLYTVLYIKRDMLMIENQIPLLVLKKLAEVVKLAPAEQGAFEEEDLDINRLVLKFCVPNESHPRGMVLGLHPLDVVRKSMLRGPPRKKTSRKLPPSAVGNDGDDIVRSAMELNESGVRFKKSKTSSLKDISFKGGVLRLPVILVDDATESLFLNLMAFERLHVDAGNDVTSYVFFMDNIIDSSKDVSLLHGKAIIQNAMGSDKAVAKLFNSLSKDVTLEADSELDKVTKKINKYCRKSINMWRANLVHTYFRSPWAFLSLAAAIFLLVLTVAQTVYTVYPYYVPNDSPAPSGTDAPAPGMPPQ